MESIHVNFDGGSWVRARIQMNDVTTLQVEHPAYVHGTGVRDCSLYWRLSEGNDIVVHTNMNSSVVEVINLCVDVVPSREGHSQSSFLVRHASATGGCSGAGRPVFDHWKAS